MIKCHVCGQECEDETELCPACGAELNPELASAAGAEETEIGNPVLAACVEDVVTAEILRDVLRENGIPFSCESQGAAMKVTFGGGFVAEEIYVDEADLEGAQALYEQVLASEPAFEDFEEENVRETGTGEDGSEQE